jgi:hypothetical protein
VALPPLQLVAEELHLPQAEDPFRAELFRPLLIEEIGYSVPSRLTVGLVFLSFVLGALLLGVVLRRAGWPTVQGWLAPAAALVIGLGFLTAGKWSRRGAAPTVAVAEIVEAVDGKEEAAVHGILAAYRPNSGPAAIGAERGGFFDMDMKGLEGQARRHLQTDMDAWNWENLSLPGDVRTAPFRTTVATGEPISARARFGPEGMEGSLLYGPFKNVSDALLAGPGGRNMAVRLAADGSFRAGSPDVLPPDQFLADAVLTDEQQRRQGLYRAFLKRPRTERGEVQPVLLAWADPLDLRFNLVADSRLVGTALLAVPLRLQRPQPGARVTIPAPLISWQRVLPRGITRPLLDSVSEADQELRFQVPAAALPLQIKRARLTARIDAPSRQITISASADGRPTELHRVDSPLDLIRVEIVDPRLLRLDEQGGLHLKLNINDPPRTGLAAQKWRIEYIDLEVIGRAE